MMEELFESLKTICMNRRSTRVFSERTVQQEKIDKILDIASTSPYASNKKSWEIVVVDQRERILQMADIVKTSVESMKERVREDLQPGFVQYAEHFSRFASAPLLMVPVFRIGRALSLMIDEPVWERDNYVKSISCVCMLILLAAESLGLKSCYMTGPLIAEEPLGEFLNLKKGRQVGAIIPIGYECKES